MIEVQWSPANGGPDLWSGPTASEIHRAVADLRAQGKPPAAIAELIGLTVAEVERLPASL